MPYRHEDRIDWNSFPHRFYLEPADTGTFFYFGGLCAAIGGMALWLAPRQMLWNQRYDGYWGVTLLGAFCLAVGLYYLFRAARSWKDIRDYRPYIALGPQGVIYRSGLLFRYRLCPWSSIREAAALNMGDRHRTTYWIEFIPCHSTGWRRFFPKDRTCMVHTLDRQLHILRHANRYIASHAS